MYRKIETHEDVIITSSQRHFLIFFIASASHADVDSFLKEVDIMKQADGKNHPNVVAFLGVCTSELRLFILCKLKGRPNPWNLSILDILEMWYSHMSTQEKIRAR